MVVEATNKHQDSNVKNYLGSEDMKGKEELINKIEAQVLVNNHVKNSVSRGNVRDELEASTKLLEEIKIVFEFVVM